MCAVFAFLSFSSTVFAVKNATNEPKPVVTKIELTEEAQAKADFLREELNKQKQIG